ncbi:MAG TPA: hypothetical protein PKD53_06200 [Chloroflexaceae bacterium]|nr:hypothetical protein [Chloroflexaceae bacterium]
MTMAVVVQLLLVGLWGTTLALHTRRLFRLAAVPATADRSRYLRGKAQRIWWWLGRDEFWEGARRDVLRSIELTLMVGLLALGL